MKKPPLTGGFFVLSVIVIREVKKRKELAA